MFYSLILFIILVFDYLYSEPRESITINQYIFIAIHRKTDYNLLSQPTKVEEMKYKRHAKLSFSFLVI